MVPMPIGGLFVGMSDAQKGGFVKRLADKLQTHRQPVYETAWHRQTGKARHIYRNSTHVGQLHLQRDCLLPYAESGGRGGRRNERIKTLEGTVEIAPNEGSSLLGAAIVSIVVACRERVGSHHDALLYFGAKPFIARFLGKADMADPLFGTQAIAHPIKTCEVAAALRRRDNVVGGQGIVGGRQAALLHSRP